MRMCWLPCPHGWWDSITVLFLTTHLNPGVGHSMLTDPQSPPCSCEGGWDMVRSTLSKHIPCRMLPCLEQWEMRSHP